MKTCQCCSTLVPAGAPCCNYCGEASWRLVETASTAAECAGSAPAPDSAVTVPAPVALPSAPARSRKHNR